MRRFAKLWNFLSLSTIFWCTLQLSHFTIVRASYIHDNPDASHASNDALSRSVRPLTGASKMELFTFCVPNGIRVCRHFKYIFCCELYGWSKSYYETREHQQTWCANQLSSHHPDTRCTRTM